LAGRTDGAKIVRTKPLSFFRRRTRKRKKNENERRVSMKLIKIRSHQTLGNQNEGNHKNEKKIGTIVLLKAEYSLTLESLSLLLSFYWASEYRRPLTLLHLLSFSEQNSLLSAFSSQLGNINKVNEIEDMKNKQKYIYKCVFCMYMCMYIYNIHMCVYTG
jgi:hypothetical protein